MSLTPRQIIDRLRGDEEMPTEEMQSLCLTGATPSEWTHDEILEMSVAAAGDTSSVFSLRMEPGMFNHQTITPIEAFLANTIALGCLYIDEEEEEEEEDDDDDDDDDNRRDPQLVGAMFDSIYIAVARNEASPIEVLHLNGVRGTPHHLLRFLASSTKIEELFVFSGHDRTLPLSTEHAEALAVGLEHFDSLKKFDFHCDAESTRRVAASLNGHPNIETVDWTGNFDEEGARALFALCRSCPKIKDFDLCGDFTGGPPCDVSKLLLTNRFSESLETLFLRGNLTAGAVDPTFYDSISTNNNVRSLYFADTSLGEDSLARLLRHFSGLKRLHFSNCEGATREILCSNLGALAEQLGELYIGCFTNEVERVHLLANIAGIVAQGPPELSLNLSSTGVTPQVVADIARGLQQRDAPLKKFVFRLCPWGPEAMDLFCKDVLPLLANAEELSFSGSGWSEGEARRFFRGLPRRLKRLTVYYTIPNAVTAQVLLDYLKRNVIITYISGPLRFADGLHTHRAKVDHYLDCNRLGRRLLPQHSPKAGLPIGFWPHFLANVAQHDDKRRVLLDFLVSLQTDDNTSVFQHSGLPAGAWQQPLLQEEEQDEEDTGEVRPRAHKNFFFFFCGRCWPISPRSDSSSSDPSSSADSGPPPPLMPPPFSSSRLRIEQEGTTIVRDDGASGKQEEEEEEEYGTWPWP